MLLTKISIEILCQSFMNHDDELQITNNKETGRSENTLSSLLKMSYLDCDWL